MATKAKTPAKATATKTATAKPATKTVAKKEVKTATAKPAKVAKEKVAKERKVRTASATVSPLIASITGMINSPSTSVEDLKSLRLELRKCVKMTRATVKGRKPVATAKAEVKA